MMGAWLKMSKDTWGHSHLVLLYPFLALGLVGYGAARDTQQGTIGGVYRDISSETRSRISNLDRKSVV